MQKDKYADYPFAVFIALAVITVLTPLRTLHALLSWHLVMLLPLAVYQDLFIIATLAWVIYGFFALASGRRARLIAGTAAWIVCLLLSLYSYLSIIIYLVIRRPLTFGLIVAADNLRGIQTSIDAVVTPSLIAALILAPAWTVLIAVSLKRFFPRGIGRACNSFHSVSGVAFTLIFIVVARVWSARHVPLSIESFNPDWTLISSAFQNHTPVISDKFPANFLEDFQPVVKSSGSASQKRVDSGLASSSTPLNIVMVVMESVGADRVDLSTASKYTPNLARLCQHGLVFTHVYAAEAETSAALGALFASVYPDHDWPSITQLAPSLAVPGFPAILSSHGYRTAFMHSGQLVFDRQGEFLSGRGFDQIVHEERDYDGPRDAKLFQETRAWIENHRSQPFFLTIWTQDTHHPYLATGHYDFGVHDSSLNRYLNAVRATDTFIGELAAELHDLGLADRTLLVVTGDHGEAFGEHYQLIHGGTVYNEEVHVPLLIVNPNLFPHEMSDKAVVRQIDIAPTLLALVGLEAPDSWQGTDALRSKTYSTRAYLFAGTGNFTFGLVDGRFKYIYDFQRHRSQLYNLLKDPSERRNIAADPFYSSLVREYHLRIEAWVSFQNGYLARFERGDVRD